MVDRGLSIIYQISVTVNVQITDVVAQVNSHGEPSSCFLPDFTPETFHAFPNLSLMKNKKLCRDQTDVFVLPLTNKHFGSSMDDSPLVDFAD